MDFEFLKINCVVVITSYSCGWPDLGEIRLRGARCGKLGGLRNSEKAEKRSPGPTGGSRVLRAVPGSLRISDSGRNQKSEMRSEMISEMRKVALKTRRLEQGKYIYIYIYIYKYYIRQPGFAGKGACESFCRLE